MSEIFYRTYQENLQPMKERIAYFDFLRGLAIAMVVGIHTYSLEKDSIMIRQLLNAAVPLFIAISGYFISQKRMVGKQDYISFLRKQLPKVYLPVFVWSFPLYMMALFAGKSILMQTVRLFACGFSIYYFVAFIMQCYIVLPVINRCLSNVNRKRGGVIACHLISFVWIVSVVYVNTVKGMGLPLILYAGPLPCWLMFFALGILIGQKTERKYSIALPIFITIIGYIFSIVESNYLLSQYGQGVGIKLSSFIYSAGIVYLLFSNKVERLICKTGIIYKIFVKIGSLSFGIYLIHCYLVNLVDRFPIDSWFIKFVMTLSLTILFILILKKTVPSKYHRFLGI